MFRVIALAGLMFVTSNSFADAIADVIEREEAATRTPPPPSKTPVRVADAKSNKPVAEASGRVCDRVVAKGVASVYGLGNGSGDSPNQKLAIPGRLNVRALTAAMLPRELLRTYVEVTNIKNGKRVIVYVNDNGPHARGRVIDLTPAAAERLGIPSTGAGGLGDVVVKACK